jgi:serine/threonine-protein kinase
MNQEPTTLPASEPTLDRIIHAYLKALDEGRTPDRQELLDAHPALAPELREFFAAQDRVVPIAAPLRCFAPAGAENVPLPEPFGDYEVIQEIGRGGMGVVYKARQFVGTGSPRPHRIVALKMIRDWHHASTAEVRRFWLEAENVATLDHPHIVPVYEVGEHQGSPYFSMKFIEGGSLAHVPPQFARNQRGLAQLLATAARAVHHAHQRGILHRDLKPGNILLDAQGQPHVADFGLAKRLEPDAGLSHSGSIQGTPPYMAPEQATGQKGLTTAVDVYGLGAILYELLTGRPPFRAATPLETLRLVIEQEPVRPRWLNPRVNRDLETICLKCLEKQPHKRYRSAEALADDLGRFTARKPITARRTGRVERAIMWVKRRPAIAALLLLVALAVAGGVGGTGWQYANVLKQRDHAEEETRKKDVALGIAKRAEEDANRRTRETKLALEEKTKAEAKERRRFNEVRELARKFIFDFHDRIQDLPGSTAAREFLVKTAQEYLDNLAREARGDPDLLADLADAYRKVGDVQGSAVKGNLGDPKGALETQGKALKIALLLAKADRGAAQNRRARARLMSIHLSIGRAQDKLGLWGEALASYGAARQVVEELAAADPKDEWVRRNRAVVLVNMGDTHLHAGRPEEALKHFDRALAIDEELAGEAGNDASLQQSLALTRQKVGNAQAELLPPEAALRSYRESLKVFERLANRNSDNAHSQRDLALCHSRIGQLERKAGRISAAEESLVKSLRILEGLARADEKNAEARRDVISAQEKVAILQFEQGKFAEALAGFGEMMGHAERQVERHPGNTQAVRDLVVSYEHLGRLQSHLGADGRLPPAARLKYLGESRKFYALALEASVALKTGKLPPRSAGRPAPAAGDWGATLEKTYREALKLYEFQAEQYPESVRYQRDLVRTCRFLARLMDSGARGWEEAEQLYRRALGIGEELVNRYSRMPEYQIELGDTENDLGVLLFKQGRFREARQSLVRAIEHQANAAKAHPNPFFRRLVRRDCWNLTRTYWLERDDDGAVKAAHRPEALFPKDPEEACTAATFLAMLSEMTAKEEGLPAAKRKELSRSYADKAVGQLRKAIDRGFRDAERLRKDPAFNAVRSRPEFKALLRELEEAGPGDQ